MANLTGNGRKPGVTKAERMLRVLSVRTKIEEHLTDKQLAAFCSESWGVGDTCIRGYVKDAREQLATEHVALGLCTSRWHLAKRLELFEKCVSKGDYQTALRCIQDMAKYQGIQPVEALEVSVTHKHSEEYHEIKTLLIKSESDDIASASDSFLH